jgi:oligosaccharide repeat unit polymerase
MWWAFWLAISSLNLYGLYPVTTKIYYLLLLNVVMFFVGFLNGNIFRSKNINSDLNLDIRIKVLNNKLLTGLLVIVFLTLIYYFFKFNSISFLLPEDLRMQRFTVGELFSSVVELYFFNYFIEAFVYALYAIIAYMIIYNKSKNIVFIMYLLCLILYAGIGSGRGPILYLLVALCLLYFIRNKDANKLNNSFLMEVRRNRKYKARLVISLLVFVPGIIVYAAWLTAVRGGYSEFSWDVIKIGFEGQYKQLIIYYTGPFRALEFGTLGGIDEIINNALTIIGIKTAPINVTIGGLLQGTPITVGDNISFRYAYTSVMIHYLDIGVTGIIILPYLFGLFARKSIFFFENNPSLPSLIIIIVMFQTMIFSVFSWGLQSPSSIIVITTCYVLHKYSVRKTKKI